MGQFPVPATRISLTRNTDTPAKAGIQGWGGGNLARGLVPSRADRPALASSFSPPIRHSREGENPRTSVPRKNVNRDATTYVHKAATGPSFRLSGDRKHAPHPDTGPESRGGEGDM